MRKLRRYKPAEDEIIKQMFVTHLLKEIGERLGRSVGSVHGRAKILGLELPPEERTRRKRIGIDKGIIAGRKYQFKKGHIPANAGQKMSDEVRNKIKHTFFKKGHRPHNWRPVGSMRKNTDGYWMIKTKEPQTWELFHRKLWEDKHGKLSQSKIVVHKGPQPENPGDINIKNLQVISKKENMERNTVHRYPEEIKRAIQIIGVLNRKINSTK